MGISIPRWSSSGPPGRSGRISGRWWPSGSCPSGEVRLVASARSAGRRLPVRGEEVEVLALAPEVFDGAELAFFSAGGGVSREWGPVAAERGAVVVDNSSAWRMHPEVPLVDADVNPEAAADHPLGIVANPNCTTLAMTPVLAVLRDRFGLESITPTSFQAAGGSGQKGMDELLEQAAKLVGDRELLRRGGRPESLPEGQVFPRPDRLQRRPPVHGLHRVGLHGRGAEAARRAAQDPRPARAGLPPDLCAGAGAGRPLAVGAGRLRRDRSTWRRSGPAARPPPA